MPFPTTPILDNFTGADQVPITTNWTTPLYTGEGRYKRESNELVSMIESASENCYYDVATFGPDCEAYVTFTTKGANGDGIATVIARIVPASLGAPDGYRVRCIPQAGTDIVRIARLDNGTSTQLGADMTQEFSAGDALGIQCEGSTIRAWMKLSGVWTLIGERTDATYNVAGYIGIEQSIVAGALPHLDDFGGGTFDPTPEVPPIDADNAPKGILGYGAGW